MKTFAIAVFCWIGTTLAAQASLKQTLVLSKVPAADVGFEFVAASTPEQFAAGIRQAAVAMNEETAAFFVSITEGAKLECQVSAMRQLIGGGSSPKWTVFSVDAKSCVAK